MVTLVVVYSLRTQQDQNQPFENNPLRFLIYFFSILVAFFFEALPRGYTHVQMQSSANGHDKANLFSRWVFHYMQPTVSLGRRQPLTPNDIRNVMPMEINTAHGYQELYRCWVTNKKTTENVSVKDGKAKTPSFIWTIAQTFSWPFITLTTIQLIASALQFTLPVLIKQILIFIESNDSNVPKTYGVILAIGMLFVNIAVSILMEQHFKQHIELGLKIRNALVAMVYQ
ncbi:hypothetical protein BGZ46_004628 [Entomortierella lignicola]|nr:hypothetical protein BGZ46_004628 [Entomortierella lignicola]